MKRDRPIYLDTSALLPYYREEPLSDQVQSLLVSSHEPVIITDLTRVEVASVIARWVRMGELGESEALDIEVAFTEDIADMRYTLKSLQVQDYDQAWRWLLGRQTSLRTLDALHLSCAAGSKAELVTADEQLAQSAKQLSLGHRLLRA